MVSSITLRTPSVSSASAISALRSSSELMSPHRCTTPLRTMTLREPKSVHAWSASRSSSFRRMARSELGVGVDRDMRRGERLDEVGSADDAHQLAVAQHGQALDTVFLEQHGDLAERRLLGGRDDRVGHDFGNLAAMGLGEVVRQGRSGHDRFEPPRGMLLGADLRPVHQVGLADDAHHRAQIVDHGQRADVVRHQDLDGLGHVVVRPDGDHLADHHIHGFHVALAASWKTSKEPQRYTRMMPLPSACRPSRSSSPSIMPSRGATSCWSGSSGSACSQPLRLAGPPASRPAPSKDEDPSGTLRQAQGKLLAGRDLARVSDRKPPWSRRLAIKASRRFQRGGRSDRGFPSIQ